MYNLKRLMVRKISAKKPYKTKWETKLWTIWSPSSRSKGFVVKWFDTP